MIDNSVNIDPPSPSMFQSVTEQCIVETANRFSLPEIILKAILEVEGGKTGELRVNSNGTYDIGPMQVNSIWLPKFTNYITSERILYDSCANLQIGAWILRYNVNKANGDIWQGVSSYHSSTPAHQEKYRNKIYAAIQKINTTKKT